MTPCQLCGAKSWGPVSVALERNEVIPIFLNDKPWSEHRRCDGCGAFAALAHLEPAPPPRVDPVAESLGVTDPFLSGIMKNMKEILPPVPRSPETRLERLLRAALTAPVSRRSQDLVNYVLECEDLLIAAETSDRAPNLGAHLASRGDVEDVAAAAKGYGGLYNPHGVGGGPWLVLSWKDEVAYLNWANELADRLVTDDGGFEKDWEKRAVDYIAGSRPS